ncbi:MAG TPA: hypothetical protein VEC37_02365 [Bacillota bacterium]|nr:hypothetical protein [Bacillota bacterium]
MDHRSSLILVGLLFCLLVGAGVSHAQEYYVPGEQQKWVYDAMAAFAQNGLISNYPVDWIKSGHELSRVEIAFYIKQIVERSSKASGKTKSQLPAKVIDLMRRLMVEFKGELDALGIKTTDIYQISPNLVAPAPKTTEYEDVDTFLKPGTVNNPLAALPYYYFGQYYSSFQRKSFIFLPADHVRSGDFNLLEGDVNNVNIVYQNSLGEPQLFLVVKGNLPLTNQKLISGYFMFPIDESAQAGEIINTNLDHKVLALLGEVKQLQQIENLWRFEGSLSLNGYLRFDIGLRNNLVYNHFDQGLQIGSLLVFSDSPTLRPQYEANHFGLPSYTPRQVTAVDWDDLKTNNPDSYQINIKGVMNLTPQTSVYGGIDLLYTETRDKSLFEGLLPPKTKYSAGVNYQMNDYWTLLSYQSFVNSNTDLKTELLSTTSLGVEYNNWVTLWLAYQMLDFKSDQKVTGVLSFRF